MSETATEHSPQDLIEAFKKTMRRLTATVTIVTSGAPGSRSGMTATAVTSLCTDPPALLVCVNRAASIHTTLALGSRFCINILGDAHADLAIAFGGKTEPEWRFSAGDWEEDDHAVPVLTDAAAAIFCTADRSIDYGTHSIIIGKVYATRVQFVAQALLYGDGKFITTKHES